MSTDVELRVNFPCCQGEFECLLSIVTDSRIECPIIAVTDYSVGAPLICYFEVDTVDTVDTIKTSNNFYVRQCAYSQELSSRLHEIIPGIRS